MFGDEQKHLQTTQKVLIKRSLYNPLPTHNSTPHQTTHAQTTACQHTNSECVWGGWTNSFAGGTALRKRPDPFRTWKLSLAAAKILHPQGCGKLAPPRKPLTMRRTRPDYSESVCASYSFEDSSRRASSRRSPCIRTSRGRWRRQAEVVSAHPARNALVHPRLNNRQDRLTSRKTIAPINRGTSRLCTETSHAAPNPPLLSKTDVGVKKNTECASSTPL